jgi:predicted CXXCH cytochrome family protein
MLKKFWSLSVALVLVNIINADQDQFIGSKACQNCHPDQFSTWQQSTHGNAGGKPNKRRVLAPFDGTRINLENGWFIPYSENGRFFFRAQENSFPERKYEVIGVVGGGHIYGGGTQTYFGLFPDGTMRLLPFDYQPSSNTWFFETNDQSGWVPVSKALSFRKSSEWPPSRTLGVMAEKQNCQQCHGSQIRTAFSSDKGKYISSYTDLSINCESCHGPGKEHANLMQYGKSIIQGYTGIKSLKTLSKQESVEVCAQCHALKDMIKPGYSPGKDFQDYFSTKFAMLGGNPFYPDGRIKAFGYQQNHVFSDCFINGSMTCVDCHNPHSNEYQDVNRIPLKGKFDNGQCTSCHMAKASNIVEHTFHKQESEGSLCTSCHMPFTQHKAVGKTIKFARADHTISIPRPLVDQALNINNACQQCHAEMSLVEVSKQMSEWYGELKPLHPLETALMKFNDNSTSEGLVGLLGSNSDPSPQVFAGLSKAFMFNQPKETSEIINKLKHLCSNSDVDIKGLALAYLYLLKDEDESLNSFVIKSLAASGKDQTKIRTRWSTALSYRAEDQVKKGRLMPGINLYEKAVKIWPRNVKAKKGLAESYILIGDFSKAIQTFGEIIQANEMDWQGWAGLGNTQTRLKQLDLAVEAYMRSLEINVYNPRAHLGIGNVLFKLKKNTLAEMHLQKAIDLDPSLSEAYIYLAATKIRLQDYKMAATILDRGLILNPQDEAGTMMKVELNKIEN